MKIISWRRDIILDYEDRVIAKNFRIVCIANEGKSIQEILQMDNFED